MNPIIDKMNDQFNEIHAIAIHAQKMANQAIDERDKARKALLECVQVLESANVALYQAAETAKQTENCDLTCYVFSLDRTNAAIQSAKSILEGK